MKRKPQPAASQKKRSKKQTSATNSSQSAPYPPPSSQPPTRSSSLTALEIKARNAKYYKPDASLPPPILSGQTKSHYPVRSTSFPSQLPPQTKAPTTYDFSSSTPQTSQLQTLLSVLSSAQNRNSVLSVLSLMDASKPSSTTGSSSGSTSSSKGNEDAFAAALKGLLSAASVASTGTGPTPATNPPVALLAPPPNKINDLPSPSSSGEDDIVNLKPSAGSTPEDSSSTACVSPEVRRVDKDKVSPDKENVHPVEHLTPSKKYDSGKTLSPATSPSRPLGRSNTMTSPIRPIDVSSSSRRKRTISDAGDANERVRSKARLLKEATAAGPVTFSFDDALTDPLEGVKRRLFSLSSHYTAQYHSDPTFDSLPPSSSQGSTSSMTSDCERKPLAPSSSSPFIRSTWATAKVKNASLVESDPPSESSAITNADGKKRFVVPDWAKTQTSTVPRLSEETAAKLEAAEAEKTAQMKMNKKARSAAARKRKLEQMVAEDENIDRSPPPTRSQGKQGETKPKAQEKGHVLGLKNASNKPVTPKKNKPGNVYSVADLPLVASSSPAIFNSSPLASRSRDLLMKTPTRRRRNSSPSRTPTKRSAARATSESPLFTPDGPAGGITPSKKLPSLFSTISPLRKGHKSPPILKTSSSSVTKRVVIDLEQDEDEDSMNSLPNPSSDVEEPEAPAGHMGRLADAKLLSSSPPPSSPIMTSSDMDLPPPEVVIPESSENEITEATKSELPTTSTLACHPPSTTNFQPTDNDFMDFMLQATSLNSHPPTAPSPSQASAAKFASEIFDWGSDDTLAGSSSATPFDDFEFLENSGLTQPISSGLGFDYGSLSMDDLGGLGDVGAEFEIGEFWQSVKPLMGQDPSVTDGAPGTNGGTGEGLGGDIKVGDGNKLAGEMVDLFGGCLV